MNLFRKIKDTGRMSKSSIILVGIIFLGIFLRVYHFDDWLRFSMDQSRDAIIVGNAVAGESSLPLLGPLAGGTNFHLGPAYYYFSFISAKLFGNYPDRMAYPSLIFSILAIPLLYFLLKEYFSNKISLSLMAIMSVSYFCVFNSRFSSNPNLAPFFVLLFIFAFLKLINSTKKIKWYWSVLIGLSLGIGIQLHTTLLVILPFFSMILFLYLLKRDGFKKYILSLVLILTTFLLFNITQVIHEVKTKGLNTNEFILGLRTKGDSKKGLFKKIQMLVVCQAKSNANIVVSLAETEKCSDMMNLDLKIGSKELYPEIKNRNLRKTFFTLNTIFVVVFFVSGYFLLGRYFIRENDKKKKHFLGVIILFNLISLFFMMPVIASMSINYFIILFFVPFIFLGLIFKLIEEKLNINGKWLILILTAGIMLLSLIEIKKVVPIYEKGFNNTKDNSDLRIAQQMGSYIAKKTQSSTVCLSGEKKYLERYFLPLKFILSRFEIEAVEMNINDVDNLCNQDVLFYVKNGNPESKKMNELIRGYEKIDAKRFYKIDIYVLKNAK